MSQRNRFADVALGLVAGLGIALLILVWTVPGFRNPANSQIRQPNTQQAGTNDGERQPVKTVHWGLFTPEDTYAQWIAAISAIAGVGVSIWAVRLVRDTLELNRNATKAAQDAVGVARDIGQAQVRAYVRITSGSAHMGPGTIGMTDMGIRPVLRIVVKNHGQSPAQWFRWSASILYLYGGSANEFRGSTEFASRSWGKDIGVAEEIHLSLDHGAAVLSEEDLAAFNRHEFHLTIIIRYVFTDVFGEDIEDERIFSCSFAPGTLNTEAKFFPNPFDRETVEEIARLNRPSEIERLKKIFEGGGTSDTAPDQKNGA